jgi:hypothetical protein
VTLDELRPLLLRFIQRELDLAALHAWIGPILAADSLDVADSPHGPWEAAPEDARLFWRLVYHVEVAVDEEVVRADAARIMGCLESTRDASLTYELLPLLFDQSRLETIVRRHLAGIISRTGFLNVITESGYPAHVKLWLEHAEPAALGQLAAWLAGGAYREVADAMERKP